jgi:hypothetical protein
MRSDELAAAVRNTAYIGDANAFPQYTDARILQELNDKLQTVFNDVVVKARAGYWLKSSTTTLTVGRARYRIPARAVVGGLEKVEIADANGNFRALSEVPASVAQTYTSSAAGSPALFWIQGDQVELLPTPAAALQLRLSYYIKPSALVTSQSSVLGGDNADRGRITSIATIAARQVTVNALPFDQTLSPPAVISPALQRIDIVHPDGWHELSLVSHTQTITGFIFTIGGTADLSDVAVGDYVRVADQTDWPCLPDDFHRCLADVAAVKVLLQLSMNDKADAIASNVGNDLERFRSLLLPRVKSQPKQIGCSPIRGASSNDWLRRY